jgi:hypothetical protein
MLLATAVVGQPFQPVPAVTLVSASAGLDIGHGLDLSLGVTTWATSTWRRSRRCSPMPKPRAPGG